MNVRLLRIRRMGDIKALLWVCYLWVASPRVRAELRKEP